MSADHPRVLVTGAGGPSAVSILLAMEGAPVTMLAADIDPFGAGLYLVPPSGGRSCRAARTPPSRTRCSRSAARARRRRGSRPSTRTAAARDGPARYAESGVTLVVASEQTLRVCLDKWLLAERCRSHIRVPTTAVVDDAFDVGAWALPVIVKPRSGSGSRGIHLLERREQLEALERDGTLLVQEHLPGVEHSLDVLARADGHVVAVVPRARLKVDSGIAVTGRTLHDDRLDTFARETARLIDLTTVANVQVKEDVTGQPALLEVNARFPGTMPLTVGSGVDMPRLAIGEALGTAIPDGPMPFRDIAMVRFFQERFFAVEELDRSAARRRARALMNVNLLQDMHVHSTFSDGRDTLEANVAQAETLGLTQLGCVDHVRADTAWAPAYASAVQRVSGETGVELQCGIEAKLLDTSGALDLPEGIGGVDAIYVADHQVPLADGPNHPDAVRARLERGQLQGRGRPRRDRDRDHGGARPPRARRHRPLPERPAEDRAGGIRRPGRPARRTGGRDAADRAADRDLRALEVPVGGDAAAVRAPRRADRAEHRQPPARRPSAATTTASA